MRYCEAVSRGKNTRKQRERGKKKRCRGSRSVKVRVGNGRCGVTAVGRDQAYAGRYTVSQREETSQMQQAASVYCLMLLADTYAHIGRH